MISQKSFLTYFMCMHAIVTKIYVYFICIGFIGLLFVFFVQKAVISFWIAVEFAFDRPDVIHGK